MVDECERVDSNHHSAGRLLYRQVSSPVLSVREEGGRPDSNRHQRASQARMLTAYTTATMKQRLSKTGTTGIEPAASRSTTERSLPLSYIPDSAGGIRTHDLEL